MRFKLIILSLVLSFTSLSIFATDNSTFSIEVVDENTFAIDLANIKQAEIKIRIKDPFGTIIYDEKLMDSSLHQKKYDLKKLPLGNYTLLVAYDDVFKIQSINKNLEKIEIDSEDLQTIYQPVFRQHAIYIDLHMLCLTDLSIYLKIKDNEGNIIYTEINQPSGPLEKRFNFSRLEAGKYSFSVEIEDALFYNEFNETLIEWSPPTVAAL